MKRSIVRIGVFLILLILILGAVNSIFSLKFTDGIFGMKKFYELKKNSVDILFLGSSHAFEDFNPGTLWDEYGISSFVLGGSAQPLWNTYFYLKEALKTQTPKLIVLESCCTMLPIEYTDDSRIMKNNFGLHWSPDKIRSLLTSVPEGRLTEFILEYTQYHSRYKELDRDDFVKDMGDPEYDNWMGYIFNPITAPMVSMDVTDVTESWDMHPKGEKYFRAIIELALEKNIPIFVVLTPYAGINDYEQKFFNKAKEISEEYQVPFANFNLMLPEIGMDYLTDAADPGHLNYKGSRKFSRFFGRYVLDNFDLGFTDHRGDSAYAPWQENADILRRMSDNQDVRDTEDIAAALKKVSGGDYMVFLSVKGLYACDTINSYLDILGLDPNEASGMWYLKGSEILWHSSKRDNEFYLSTDAHDFCLSEGPDHHDMFIDRELFPSEVTDGATIIVYDEITDKEILKLDISALE